MPAPPPDQTLTMPYERDNIARLDAYTPGEQPGYADTARATGFTAPGTSTDADTHAGTDAGPRGIIKLNTNENPYPPSPRVVEAIRAIDPEALRLYPPARAMPFRRAAAAAHGLRPEQVIATNGGDELLRLLVSVFVEPGDANAPGGLAMLRPSYSLYSVLAEIHDAPVRVFDRLGEDDDPPYALPDPEAVAERWNRAGCRLGFVVNPHAPSGRLEPLDRLEALARGFRGVLVVDEAYADFADHDALPLVRDAGSMSGEGGGAGGGDAGVAGLGLPNVVILRSLSKGYGLAGLRFGYGLAHDGLIAAMDKARDSYNTDIVSQLAAAAAIADRDYAARTWRAVIAERARLADALTQRGWRVFPSQSNFLLAVPPITATATTTTTARTPADTARSIYAALKDRGILIRYF